MIYVTSDWHGYPVEKIKELFDSVCFNKDDVVYILGDVIDRGDYGIELLKWIKEEPNMKLIMGNHERMMLNSSFIFYGPIDEAIERMTYRNQRSLNNWIDNGAKPTIKGLMELPEEERSDILDYVSEAPLYEDITVNGKRFLLVHSGLGDFSPYKEMCDYSDDELLWERPEMTDCYYDDAITIFGHTPTRYMNEEGKDKAIITKTWVDIDTGAACGGAPMLLRLDDMKEFYI